MTYVIAQPCVDLLDKACIEECPVDCIYEGKRMLYIHPDECVDCGACEPVCPVEAIFYEDDTPEQWKDYYKANVEFFDDLGSPGGAAKIGKIDKDHPLVAALPPQPAPRPLSPLADRPRCRRAESRACVAACPTSPGTRLAPYGERGPGPPGRRRRPVRRHARRPDAPTWCRTLWRAAADAPGYPPTLRHARAARRPSPRWLARRLGRPGVDPARVLPTIGSKELVAWLPTLLGLGAGRRRGLPEIAYPTYDVGATARRRRRSSPPTR